MLLFFQATCCNSCIAVFYCMEQWMAGIHIASGTRGLLLAVMAIALFVGRPVATWFLYGRRKTALFTASILVTALCLAAYPLIPLTHAVPIIFFLRALQGLALAVYSSCTTSLLAECIPKGQSARGFAIFSLTLLIPFAVIPAVGEELILLVGGEAELFAATASLSLPALLTLPYLTEHLNRRLPPADSEKNKSQMWKSLALTNLGLVYFACLTFSIMTNEAIFFMKGLCTMLNALPAYFFTTYTSTIMLIRVIGNHLFDSLPRYPIMLGTAMILAFVTYKMSATEGSGLIPLSAVYGAALGLLYPLLASLVCDRSKPAIRPLNLNLMMAAFDLSSCLAPIIGGIILSQGFGYQGVFLSISVSISLSGTAIAIDWLTQRRGEKLTQ